MRSNYAIGVFTGLCLGYLYFMFPAIIDTFRPEPNKQPITPKTNFEVVDEYKGCDVVRWTQSNFAEYKYFLHCKN
jgi:hypothetical protein